MFIDHNNFVCGPHTEASTRETKTKVEFSQHTSISKHAKKNTYGAWLKSNKDTKLNCRNC